MNFVNIATAFLLSLSLHALANPIIGVDETDMVTDVDMLLKIPAYNKAQKLEEDLAAQKETPKIEVIVDSSGSMAEILVKDKSKMYYLRELMKGFFRERWKEKNEIGLRVFSGLTQDKCTDSRLMVPFSKNRIDQMEKIVSSIRPMGMTPLHKSLQIAFDDLKSYKGPKRVVVVTDGQDTCGGDPCKMVEEWKKQELDLKFYVIALGFKGDSESFKKVQCIGDTQLAQDDKSFQDAMSQISSKLSQKENLQVISPDPGASVYLYKIENGKKELFRVFYAYSGQTVPPGKYEAIVNLQPAYKFSEFTIKPGKKMTLKVYGDGTVTVNYFNNLVNVEILDKNNRAVARFKSDRPTLVPTGKWILRVFKDPFYEYTNPDFMVSPLGKHEYNASGIGAIKINTDTPEGVYVYDQEKKEVGNYLTNSPIVIKSGIYTFHVNKDCSFPKVQIGERKELLVIDCGK